jgi:hypothetical protein
MTKYSGFSNDKVVSLYSYKKALPGGKGFFTEIGFV